MEIKLERPLIIFDLETTGVQVKTDRIVEIAALKVNPDGSQEQWESLVNPEIPIPPGAARVHGITDEEVAEAPTLAELGDEILEFFYLCDYGGYNNAKFDVPLFQNECDRVGIPLNLEAGNIVDVYRIFKHFEKQKLADAVRFYCGHEIEDAHEAMADVRATLEVFMCQMQRYGLSWNMSELSGKLKPPGALDDDGKLKEVDGLPVLQFGKHQNKPLNRVPSSYITWLMDNEVMPSANHILEQYLPKRKKKQ